MKNPRLIRWKDPVADQGLLLFAQRLEESVFDYSPESYKVSALNSHTRCLELRYSAVTVRAEGLPRHTLTPMVQELAASLRVDFVARKLIHPHEERFGKSERWDLESTKVIEVQVRQLLSALSGVYEQALVEELRSLIPAGKKKREIASHSISLAIEWLNRGFSKGYIYASVRDHFFIGAGPAIDGLASFDSFLALFPAETPMWSVTIRGSAAVRQLKPILKDICVVHDLAPAPRTNRTGEKTFLSADHDGVFLTFDEITAPDARVALERANRHLSRIATFASLHAHKLDFSSDGCGLVYAADGSVLVLTPIVPAVRKHQQGRGLHLTRQMSKTAEALGPDNLPQGSFRRVVSALRMHATAVGASSGEEQLYALWIALESLLPFGDAESRIGRMVDVLVPLLSREYPRRLIQDLELSLNGCIRQVYVAALTTLPDSMTDLEKCAALVTAVDTQDERDELFAACDHNPLLRHRLYEVSEKLRRANRIRETIREHEQRIAWHLRRIYRTRNSLVHTGRSLPNLDSIVESLHSYFFRVLQLAQEAFSAEQVPFDLDGALLRARLDHEWHFEVLIRAGEEETTVINSRLHVLGAL